MFKLPALATDSDTPTLSLTLYLARDRQTQRERARARFTSLSLCPGALETLSEHYSTVAPSPVLFYPGIERVRLNMEMSWYARPQHRCRGVGSANVEGARRPLPCGP